MKRISILGSGWLGLPLASELQEIGYQVKTSSRSPDRIQAIQQQGVDACLYDIESEHNDGAFLQGDILIINITNKNIEAFKALITQIERSPIRQVLFISSTSVYVDSTEQSPVAITEDNLSALKPCPLLEIERLFIDNHHFETSIIRFAGLIGYQRHPGRFFLQHDENNEITCKPIRNPDGFVNMIHRDDCIGIIQALLKQDSWGEIFNGCSSQHPTRREFYSWAIEDYCNTEKIEIQFLETVKASYKIIDNHKVKNHLDYDFIQDDLFSLSF